MNYAANDDDGPQIIIFLLISRREPAGVCIAFWQRGERAARGPTPLVRVAGGLLDSDTHIGAFTFSSPLLQALDNSI